MLSDEVNRYKIKKYIRRYYNEKQIAKVILKEKKILLIKKVVVNL